MRRRWIGLAAVVAALVATFLITHRPDAARGATGGGGGRPGGAGLTAVQVARVTQGPFQASLRLAGTVVARDQVQLAPQVSGQVVALNADVGQSVRAGDVLARVDDGGGLAQQVAQARAQLAQAEMQLQQMVNPGAFVTQTQLTQAQLAVQSAQANLAQQQANLAAAQAAAAVTAPASGTVQYVSVMPGQNVAAGDTLAAVVAPGSPVVVKAQIPQTGFVGQVGDPAAVIVNAVGQTFNGTVTAIGNGNPTILQATPAGTPGSRGAPAPPPSGGGAVNVTVTLPAEAASADLKDGMTALVTISDPAGQSPQGPGVVQFQNDWVLTAPQAANVAEVDVKPGDSVTAGQTLIKLGGPSVDAALQRAQAAVQQAQAQLQQAQQNLEALVSPQPAPAPAVAAQQQVVEQDRQILALKERQAAQLEVRAPFDGVVTARNVSLGATVSPATPLFTLQGRVLEVQVAVPQQDVGQVHVGDPATVVPVGGPATAVPGHVAIVTPAASPQSLTFTVYVLPDQPSPALQPGASVNVTLTTASLPSALTVPTAAVQTIDGRTQVYVVDSGVLRLVPVQLGPVGTVPGSSEPRQQVLSGLQPGDQVVISDATYLAPGDRVQVVNLSGAPGAAPGGAGGGRGGSGGGPGGRSGGPGAGPRGGPGQGGPGGGQAPRQSGGGGQ